jgi:competence protein ComEA
MKKTIINIGVLILWLLVIAGLLHNAFAGETVINVNTATHEELTWLKGIGKVKAERIIEARPFAAADSLINVQGIGKKTLAWIKPFVTVEDSVVTHIHNSEVENNDTKN